MSLHELRAGLGLLLALALIIGGSLGIGLPLAALIIWLFSCPPGSQHDGTVVANLLQATDEPLRLHLRPPRHRQPIRSSPKTCLTRVFGGENPSSAAVSAPAPAALPGPFGIAPATARNWQAASRQCRAAFRGWRAASPPPRGWKDHRGVARGAVSRNVTDATVRGSPAGISASTGFATTAPWPGSSCHRVTRCPRYS